MGLARAELPQTRIGASHLVDKKALKILFDTYWSSGGWKDRRRTPPRDFQYARAAGVMFDPIKINHDEQVARAVRAVHLTDRGRVAAAFLASLGTRRLEIRSALGSYAAGRHLPLHRHTRGDACPLCGVYGGRPVAEDLSVLSFERYKWGGVRHTDPVYIGFDLDRFREEKIPRPTPDDLGLLQTILECARRLPARATATDLAKALGTLPANSSERRGLIAILGYSGILQPTGRPGFRRAWIDQEHRDRDRPPQHTNDWQYPIIWWRGRDGVNDAAVRFWFAKWLR